MGVHTIALTPERLSVENPLFEVRAQWPKFVEITESTQHLVFLLGPVIDFIIPKAAVRDAEHAREFLETARAYQAGTLPVSITIAAIGKPDQTRRA